MHLLILSAFALLPLILVEGYNVYFDGLAPSAEDYPSRFGSDFHLGPETKGKLHYLPPNVPEKCTKELYKPAYQLPLLTEYTVIYNKDEYGRATTKVEAFEKDLKIEKASKETVKRFCHPTEDPKVKRCIIRDYEEYKPNGVIGLHLARGYLLASHWIKPDYWNVIKYISLWHTETKDDFLINHEEDKNEKRKLDRCSFAGQYKAIQGYPINPYARTGLKYLGELYQWGPVRGVGAILWVENKHGQFGFIGVLNGKYEREDDRRLTTPGGYIELEEEFEFAAKRELIEEAFGMKLNEKTEEIFKMKMERMGKGELVIYGYNDAKENNTDNAWNESVTYAFEIKHEHLNKFEPIPGSDATRAMWFTLFTKTHAEQLEGKDEKTIDIKALLDDKKHEEKMEKIANDLKKTNNLRERIQYILNNFSVCWVEEVKKVKKHRCIEMNNNKKVLNMENVARLFLVKKYGEKPFMKLLEILKDPTHKEYREELFMDIISNAGKIYHEESQKDKDSGVHGGERQDPKENVIVHQHPKHLKGQIQLEGSHSTTIEKRTGVDDPQHEEGGGSPHAQGSPGPTKRGKGNTSPKRAVDDKSGGGSSGHRSPGHQTGGGSTRDGSPRRHQ